MIICNRGVQRAPSLNPVSSMTVRMTSFGETTRSLNLRFLMCAGGPDQMIPPPLDGNWLRQHKPIMSSVTCPKASRPSPLLLSLMFPFSGFPRLALCDLWSQLTLLLSNSPSFCLILHFPSLKLDLRNSRSRS